MSNANKGVTMSENQSAYHTDGEVVADHEENKSLIVDSKTTSLASHQEHATGIHPLIQAAMNGQLDTDKLRDLLDIQKDYEANEAKKAFHAALSEFKKNVPIVVKDKENRQFGSMYASKASLVNTINPALGKFNLSATWDVNVNGAEISVTCILSHSMGHSTSVTIPAKPDTSGAKNPIQQIKSTITYLEIATYEAVTGVTASEYGDDDGNGFSERISEEQVANLSALIEEVGANYHAFLKYMQADSLDRIRADAYDMAIKALESKRKAS